MVRLFINPYKADSLLRQEELNFCYDKNVHNELIDEVVYVKQDERAVYSDFFESINEVAVDEDISIIANADIYFDETLRFIKVIKTNECFVLSRREKIGDEITHVFAGRSDTQDVWIFRGKVLVARGDIKIGVPACDHMIARRIHDSGYSLINPSGQVRAVHVHESGIRSYTDTDRLPDHGYMYVKETRI